ncbi:MAG: hypothetical protein KTR24_00725 [Saprospiraceae bacterium]|nr:hypothetical protein [Saprospiraceae bacterium]
MEKGIAKCTNCDHVFTFQEFIEEDPIAASDFGELPEGLDVLKLRSLLEIRVNHNRARSGSVAGPAFFALMWNIFLLPFLFFIVTSGQWHVLFFISLHLFAGISMLRNVFGQLLNRTTIETTAAGIAIVTKPFGSRGKGNIEISREEISHLTVAKGKRSFNVGGSLALHIHRKQGKPITILHGIDRPTLLYVKAAIEDYMRSGR